MAVKMFTAALALVSASHLLLGLANLLRIPPYDPANIIVDGTPGTGETPLEKLLEAVMAGWYLASIAAVLFAFFFGYKSGYPAPFRFSLVCPLLYHLLSSYNAIFLLPDWGVCNPAKQGPNVIVSFHLGNSLLFLYLVIKT